MIVNELQAESRTHESWEIKQAIKLITLTIRFTSKKHCYCQNILINQERNTNEAAIWRKTYVIANIWIELFFNNICDTIRSFWFSYQLCTERLDSPIKILWVELNIIIQLDCARWSQFYEEMQAISTVRWKIAIFLIKTLMWSYSK